jgi:pantothenate kinase type III
VLTSGRLAHANDFCMPSTFLSVDLGNSRCKLCVWTIAADVPPKMRAAHELESRAGLGEAALAWLASERDIDSAAVSSVAARALEDELCAALDARLNGGLQRRPDPGVAIECRDPDAVGRDRVFAARGAWELVKGSAIVVDAGTALTVDALRAGGSGGLRAVFLGGAIAPGPTLLAEALARGTARLPLVEPRVGASALGRDTESALQSGVVVGFRGAAHELVEGVAAEASLASAPVVLTGGARAFLLRPSAFGSRSVREAPDLVHRGLIAACSSPLAKR